MNRLALPSSDDESEELDRIRTCLAKKPRVLPHNRSSSSSTSSTASFLSDSDEDECDEEDKPRAKRVESKSRAPSTVNVPAALVVPPTLSTQSTNALSQDSVFDDDDLRALDAQVQNHLSSEPAQAKSTLNVPIPTVQDFDRLFQTQEEKTTSSPSSSHDDTTTNAPNEAGSTAQDSTKTVNERPLNLEAIGIEVENRASEIHPAYYAPPHHQPRPEPLVHRFSKSNRPTHQRRQVPISQVFQPPISSLWKFETFNQLQSEICNMMAYR
jgi:hypothetical protein